MRFEKIALAKYLFQASGLDNPVKKVFTGVSGRSALPAT